MKSSLLISVLFILASFTVIAQDEVAGAAKEACACMKELDPSQLSERDLKISILGCVSKPIDAIAEELTKKGKWSEDSSAFYYLGKIGQEARALCPEEYQRLKKKEVEIDPAILKISPTASTVSGFAQATCNCLSVVNDLNLCMKRVGAANEAELTKRFPDDPFTAMMQTATDVMFELADYCEAASSNETLAKLKKIPAVKEGCNKIALGDFTTTTMLGETKSTFTATRLKEFTNGKLSAEYELKWDNCTITLKCLSSTSESVKKGDVSTMEIRRGSNDAFIAFVSLGKMKVPVNYQRVQ